MTSTVPLRDEDIETRHHAGSLTADPRLGDDADDADGTDATDDADDADGTDATDDADDADADGTDR